MSDDLNKPDSETPQDDESSKNSNDKELNKKETKDSDGSKLKNPDEEPQGSLFSDGKEETNSSNKPQKSSRDSESDNPKDNDIQKSLTDADIRPVQPSTTSGKPKVSNYQISLIDENYLKVSVATKKGIKINSSLIENKKNAEIQNNEIYLNPRIDLSQQEVEIHITIDEDSDKETDKSEDKELTGSGELDDNILKDDDKENIESKFKVSPINENLLKVKIKTDKSVKIDSVAKDKKTSLQTQSNRVLLLPDRNNKFHLIEITIELDPEIRDINEELTGSSEDGKIKFIPNPEVVDLIQPPDYSEFPEDEGFINPAGGFINPFDKLRHLIRRNLTIGLVIAVVLHLVAAGIAFYTIGKKSEDQQTEEQPRLIVLQDLPDPKIKLQDVEDPNKPKIEDIPADENPDNPVKREITPRRIIQPPKVNRPDNNEESDTLPGSELAKELDSLRKLADALEGDTTDTLLDSLQSNYVIPDSLRNNFSEQDIGLAMYFPNNWKLTDQRDINKNEKEFKGVVLTDTTAEQPGTMTLFVFLDSELKDFNTEDFKMEFAMNDTTLSGFVKEPKTLAGFTEYRFYVFNKIGTEKLSLRASVRKQYFDQYKNEIESVVRSINIRKNINNTDSTKQAPSTIPDESEGEVEGKEEDGTE